MISMATGAYLGSKAEQDVRQAEIAREAAELETKPAEELGRADGHISAGGPEL